MSTGDSPRDKSDQPREAPVVPSRRLSRWWTWGLALLGFAIGCEVHVQRALLGMPATPFLLAAGGAILGTLVGRLRWHGDVPAPVAPLRSDLRRLLKALLLIWVVAVLAISGIGLVMFFWPNLLRRGERAQKPPEEDDRRNVKQATEFPAGPPDQFDENAVIERFRDRGVYLVRWAVNDVTIFALHTACTHCARTVNWLESEQKFKCPQCGSGYRISGVHFEGPARRPLERLAIRIAAHGQLTIDPARRFRKELGQWNDPESFVRQ